TVTSPSIRSASVRSTISTDCFLSSSREMRMALKLSGIFTLASCWSAVRSVAGRPGPLADTDEFIQNDEACTHRDEGIGQVEDGEGPDGRVEKDVIYHMPVNGPVDQVSYGAAKDEREAGTRHHLLRPGARGEIEHEGGHHQRNQDQAVRAQKGQHRKRDAGVVRPVKRQERQDLHHPLPWQAGFDQMLHPLVDEYGDESEQTIGHERSEFHVRSSSFSALRRIS